MFIQLTQEGYKKPEKNFIRIIRNVVPSLRSLFKGKHERKEGKNYA